MLACLKCNVVLLSSLVLCGASGCGREDGSPETLARTKAALAPAGYYDSVDPTSASALRTTLHAVIHDHTRFPYTSTATDTWIILEAADEDPANPNQILDIYKNATYPKFGAGNNYYNREHVWPKSYGFPLDNAQNYPYTDCHHLHLGDAGYNSSRSNKPYRYCTGACTEKPTLVNDGLGGGTGVYAGNSNWTSGSYTAGTWETWSARRGDVARSLLYMDIRYEGGTHGVTGVAEPDLIVTDDESLIAASNTGSNEPVAYMGMLSVLLQWHLEDPVSAEEQARNDVVFGYQGNRNPFVDHPEWVACVFQGVCGGGGGCSTAAECDDGLFCNGAESCSGGACVGGSDPCSGQTCDEAANACVAPACNNDGVCQAGEDCVNCLSDCPGLLGGKQTKRYCCGNGVAEGPEADGRCDGNP
jgi:endonuclease I